VAKAGFAERVREKVAGGSIKEMLLVQALRNIHSLNYFGVTTVVVLTLVGSMKTTVILI
jgi:hypothetical protein